ncbi:hypothetical protein ACRE_013210 [Hapsidospora chrysogenum ATCC 11550]|uniref:Uncharacterized protein n=1 Tax=Hapsidospora chrysogenum (strain ATCC 11550 / CBS 779.69 / DSM 880 / IAM 14645 / JCM 23072 / IMI 49137) TaxID=857340 RepID=A0A086TEI5_HAPC1|nr:hypothetical protein ACRE_013210 [Hapsidospora chrysogenum ATCC 11550]
MIEDGIIADNRIAPAGKAQTPAKTPSRPATRTRPAQRIAADVAGASSPYITDKDGKQSSPKFVYKDKPSQPTVDFWGDGVPAQVDENLDDEFPDDLVDGP